MALGADRSRPFHQACRGMVQAQRIILRLLLSQRQELQDSPPYSPYGFDCSETPSFPEAWTSAPLCWSLGKMLHPFCHAWPLQGTPDVSPLGGLLVYSRCFTDRPSFPAAWTLAPPCWRMLRSSCQACSLQVDTTYSQGKPGFTG